MNDGAKTKNKQKKSKGLQKQSAVAPGAHAATLARDASRAAKANSQAGAALVKTVKRFSKITKDDLAAWLRCLSRPFDNPATQCPVNYNPVPSIISSLATTEYFKTIDLVASTAREIVLFPGHHREIEDLAYDNMDGTSYHCYKLLSKDESDTDAYYIVGPMSSAIAGTAIGYVSQASSTLLSTSANVSGCRAITPAVTLPYIAVESNGFHSRWKLTGMGIKLVNITPHINRGGLIESVQPSSKGTPTNFDQLAVNPTYRIHEADTEIAPFEISWIPRLQDLAYWHTEGSAISNTSSEAAIRIRLTAPSLAQTYRLEVICHWQLAGNSLLAIGTPSVHRPMDKSVVEPTVEHTANSSWTAGSMLHTAADVARGVQAGVESVARLGDSVARAAGKVASVATMFA